MLTGDDIARGQMDLRAEIDSQSLREKFDLGEQGKESTFGYGQQAADAAAIRSLDYLAQTTEDGMYAAEHGVDLDVDRAQRLGDVDEPFEIRAGERAQTDWEKRRGIDFDYQEKNLKQNWYKDQKMQRDAHGFRTEENAQRHRLNVAAEMDITGKTREWALADRELALGIEAAMAAQGNARHEALVDVYRRRRDNPELSDAMRDDAEAVMLLSPANLEKAVAQERQLLAQTVQHRDARAERGADASNASRIREGSKRNYWSWQQDEKRTQDENSPGWQNQQRYERNLGNLSEDEFMDHMMRRDYIQGTMSRNQYRSPGGGLPQYPREGN